MDTTLTIFQKPKAQAMNGRNAKVSEHALAQSSDKPDDSSTCTGAPNAAASGVASASWVSSKTKVAHFVFPDQTMSVSKVGSTPVAINALRIVSKLCQASLHETDNEGEMEKQGRKLRAEYSQSSPALFELSSFYMKILKILVERLDDVDKARALARVVISRASKIQAAKKAANLNPEAILDAALRELFAGLIARCSRKTGLAHSHITKGKQTATFTSAILASHPTSVLHSTSGDTRISNRTLIQDFRRAALRSSIGNGDLYKEIISLRDRMAQLKLKYHRVSTSSSVWKTDPALPPAIEQLLFHNKLYNLLEQASALDLLAVSADEWPRLVQQTLAQLAAIKTTG